MPRSLLQRLARRGVQVVVVGNGDRLRIRSTGGRLSPTDVAAVTSHKTAILDLLRSPWSAADARAVIDAWPNTADRSELRALYADAVSDFLKHASLTRAEAEQQAFIALICDLLQRVANDDDATGCVASTTAH